MVHAALKLGSDTSTYQPKATNNLNDMYLAPMTTSHHCRWVHTRGVGMCLWRYTVVTFLLRKPIVKRTSFICSVNSIACHPAECWHIQYVSVACIQAGEHVHIHVL